MSDEMERVKSFCNAWDNLRSTTDVIHGVISSGRNLQLTTGDLRALIAQCGAPDPTAEALAKACENLFDGERVDETRGDWDAAFAALRAFREAHPKGEEEK